MCELDDGKEYCVTLSSGQEMSVLGRNSAAAVTCTRSTRFEPISILSQIRKGIMRSLPIVMSYGQLTGF